MLLLGVLGCTIVETTVFGADEWEDFLALLKQ